MGNSSTSALYNPSTMSWEYVAEDFHNYRLGISVLIGENKILFIGGLTGTLSQVEENDVVRTCSVLTLSPK